MRLFLDKKESFSWHEDMFLDNSQLQVHYLKDLVTMVDPTNKFSFLSYLLEKGRLYPFLHRKTHVVSRLEFSDYFKWAANNMRNVNFGTRVIAIEYKSNKFLVNTNNGTCVAKNIVIGTGIIPDISKDFADELSETVFHNSQYKSFKSRFSLSNKRVLVVGGGQSGAEIIDDILSSADYPSEIAWLSRRDSFFSLEDSCFSNEFYSPAFTEYFYELSYASRMRKNEALNLTSDGITESLVNSIYDKIYNIKFDKKLGSKLPSFRASYQNRDNCLASFSFLSISFSWF